MEHIFTLQNLIVALAQALLELPLKASYKAEYFEASSRQSLS